VKRGRDVLLELALEPLLLGPLLVLLELDELEELPLLLLALPAPALAEEGRVASCDATGDATTDATRGWSSSSDVGKAPAVVFDAP